MLISGEAIIKFREIVAAQGGDGDISSIKLELAKFAKPIKSEKKGKIKNISSKSVTVIAKILGAPVDKKAGIFIEKMLGEEVEKEDEVMVLYSDSEYRLKEAEDSLALFPIFEIEK